MKVKAIKKGFGGIPPARRCVGEVFEAPRAKKGARPSSWFVEVAAETPVAVPEREPEKAPQYAKVKGEVVPAVDAGVSGGGGMDYLSKFDRSDLTDKQPAQVADVDKSDGDNGSDLT